MKITALVVSFLMLFFCASPLFAATPNRETPVVKVVREWGPNVVNIGTEKVALLRGHPFWKNYGPAYDALLQDFLGGQFVSTVKIKSIGSGVIIDSTGLIITNLHVIHMANKVFVTFNDGTVVEATILGIDQNDDLALLKVELPHPFKDIVFAPTGDVQVGETVIAIGNPLGLENSVSVGVISGKSRNFMIPQTKFVIKDLIQTDAAINVGNSGGALINLDGELVGINLAMIQNASNIGFSIPADRIKALIEQYHKMKSATPTTIEVTVE